MSFTKNTELSFISKNCRVILGYSQDEIKRRENIWLNILSNEDEKIFVDHCSKALEIEHDIVNEFCIHHGQTRKLRWLEYRIIPLKTNDFNEDLIVVLIDITERKNEEEKRKILEKQLRHTEKIESIGKLAGGIAHDFNNLLGAISGMIELVECEVSLSPKYEKRFEMILKAIDGAAKLNRQLMVFARNDDLNFEHISDLKKNMIFGDMSSLHNALLNLALNAQDAIDGSGVLTISTENKEINKDELKSYSNIEPGLFILIMVEDTGSGISEDHLLKIFDPFFTTKERTHGTGLGLASVMNTVETNKGFVTVKNKLSGGAKFTMFFPVIDSNCFIDTNLEDDLKISGNNESILLVDDEELIRESTADTLRKYGYKVYEKINGREAVDFFIEHYNCIDLVIIDMMMPVLNGKEAFLEMKKIKPEIKVILTTGYTGESDIEIGGFTIDEILKKPFRIKKLIKLITNVLDNTTIK